MLSECYTTELEQLMEQGNACVRQNKQQQALLYFNRVVLLAPEYIEALVSCAETLINLNRLAEASIYSQRAAQLHSAKNRVWIEPEPTSINKLRGKSILIHSEQGFEDSIQFFRYIPLLVELGAQVTLEILPTLIPLFFPWRTSIRFIAKGLPLPSCDYHCPLISLARLFKTEIETIPKSIPYLFPDIVALKSCQKKLGDTVHQRIGIAWKERSFNMNNPVGSIELNSLLALHQPNIDFFCLQKDLHFEEKKALKRYQIACHSLELSTLEGTVALIACLDLVITSNTSIAHLAAAMGKDVWILLPFSGDWHWFLQRDDSPWYPNATLFRQEAFGDWGIPLNRIKDKLNTISTCKPQMVLVDLIQQAHSQFQNGLFFEAEQLYRSILIKNPESHNASQGIALAALQQNNMADAIQFMQQAAEIAPTVIVYKRNLGELLRRVGQLEAAITSHHKVINLEPESSENHFLLALSYNDKHQFELAIQHYRIALSLDKNYGLAWNNLGASLECLGTKQQAKCAYKEAIRINPNHTEAQNNLGAIYSEEGLIDKARSCFEAAIAANPDFIEAHYNLSLIKTYKAGDPHLVFLEAFRQKINYCSAPARIHYYFALGKALDDTQQYAPAFKAYAEGNRLHYLQNPWNKTKLQNLVEHLPQVFAHNFFKQIEQTKKTPCPIFIVGMPRAGTTLIEQILASHKNIYGAGELSVLDNIIQEACQAAHLPFNAWVSQLTDDEFAALGEQYLDRTSILAPDKQFIIDKMPANCFYIGMIYRMLPTAKIIHAIRDPMDSCFSCFTHLFKNSMLFAYDLAALADYYSLYAQAMRHWHTVLPPTVIFDVPYEQMITNHEAFSKQLVEYIGLPWDPNCLNFYKNDRAVKTASLTQVRKPIYKTSVQRWHYFSEELQPLLEMLAPYRNIKGISA